MICTREVPNTWDPEQAREEKGWGNKSTSKHMMGKVDKQLSGEQLIDQCS